MWRWKLSRAWPVRVQRQTDRERQQFDWEERQLRCQDLNDFSELVVEGISRTGCPLEFGHGSPDQLTRPGRPTPWAAGRSSRHLPRPLWSTQAAEVAGGRSDRRRLLGMTSSGLPACSRLLARHGMDTGPAEPSWTAGARNIPRSTPRSPPAVARASGLTEEGYRPSGAQTPEITT